MLDNANISKSFDLQAEDPTVVSVESSSGYTRSDSQIPADPRVKRIHWSVTERLEIVSMTGDFTGVGIANLEEPDNQVAQEVRHHQVFAMLQEAQVQEMLVQFQTAIQRGKAPEKREVKLRSGDKVIWVEQETVIQKTPDAKMQIFSYWYDITRQKSAENERRVLKQVIDAIPSWIFLKNTDHEYEMVNEAYASTYGVTPEECIGKNSAQLGVPRSIAESFWADDLDVFSSGKPKDIPSEPIVINGQLKYLDTHKSPIKDSDGQRELLIGYCHDITYLKLIEEKIGAELRYNKALNEVDRILRLQASPYLSVDEVQELLVSELGCVEVDIRVDLTSRPTNNRRPADSLFTIPVVFDGSEIALIHVWHKESKPLSDDDRKLLFAVASKLANSFHRQELLIKIYQQANFDSLTKLPNRHNILEQVESAIESANRTNKKCAVVIMDLDGFKTINDTFGHQVGDKMLISVAQRLQEVSMANETVARLGGDEFAILMTDLEEHDTGVDRAEQYLDALRDSFDVGGRELRVGGSLGISFYPDDSNSLESILRHADRAMYMAKSRGRNICQPFTAQIAQQAQYRTCLENDLRAAIKGHRELFLKFQPKQELNTKRVAGVEALVQWDHPKFGLVSPSEFISVAEETGQIATLNAWIMREACKTVAGWNRQLKEKIVLSLNVAPLELEQRRLYDQITQTLDETALDPTCLSLEVKETALMKRSNEATECLSSLRDRGVSVSIDVFGTGYSCMSFLAHLPVDCLNIDASFIQMLDVDCPVVDGRVSSITETTVALAKSMGLQTIAAGIETEKQYERLLALGVDYGRGAWFSRPLTGDQALAFVQQQNG